jgi:hypothetical protein
VYQCNVERVLETSKKNKPKLVTKTAWVVAPTGVESSLPQVYAPERNASIDNAASRFVNETFGRI